MLDYLMWIIIHDYDSILTKTDSNISTLPNIIIGF